jgi:hypothetical protein
MVDRGETGYGPSPIDSSTRHVKQIVLWMDIIRLEQFAAQLAHFLSWPGIAVRRTASLPLAYVPAIHVLDAQKTWMPGTSPGMTNSKAMQRGRE